AQPQPAPHRYFRLAVPTLIQSRGPQIFVTQSNMDFSDPNICERCAKYNLASILAPDAQHTTPCSVQYWSPEASRLPSCPLCELLGTIDVPRTTLAPENWEHSGEPACLGWKVLLAVPHSDVFPAGSRDSPQPWNRLCLLVMDFTAYSERNRA